LKIKAYFEPWLDFEPLRLDAVDDFAQNLSGAVEWIRSHIVAR